jgi:FkbM family methyltransferase
MRNLIEAPKPSVRVDFGIPEKNAPSTYQSRDILVRGKTRPFYLRDGTTDDQIFELILARRQYDLERLRRANELASFLSRQHKDTGKRRIIIDAGANIGASTVFFADHVPDAFIFAIEPEANFRLLSKNVENLQSVRAVEAAIAAKKGRMRVIDPGIGHWGFRTESTSAADGTVPCITVSDIYRQMEARCFPFLVKVDIEGGEADLFSANTKWVARTPVIVVELHDWLLPKSANSRAFLQCISTLNRDFVYIGENIYSIANDL